MKQSSLNELNEEAKKLIKQFEKIMLKYGWLDESTEEEIDVIKFFKKGTSHNLEEMFMESIKTSCDYYDGMTQILVDVKVFKKLVKIRTKFAKLKNKTK